MSEIIMETSVQYDMEFDGTNWHVTVEGKAGGPPMTKTECGDIIRWLGNGGGQFMMDRLCDLIDKAFNEHNKGK